MTRRFLVDTGGTVLDVTVKGDPDLDGAFTATCNETGETLLILGWMADDITEVTL